MTLNLAYRSALFPSLLFASAACSDPAGSGAADTSTMTTSGGAAGSAGSAGSSGGTSGSGAAPACPATGVDGIRVAPSDPGGGVPYALGYPPYAVHDCLLAYVAEPSGGVSAGALVLRDLASGDETIVAAAAERPRRPALAGDFLAWEAEEAGKRVVRVRSGGASATLKGAFDHAGEPRAAADGVVFTAFLGADDSGDTDVFFAAAGQESALPIASGPGQQRFADISATHIAFADFSEDPDGRFDEDADDVADIALYDRAKKTIETRQRSGKQAFPMLGAAGKVAYLSWGPDHPEPKFSAYQLLVGDIATKGDADELAADIITSAPYVRPAAHGDLLFWIQWPTGKQAALMRRPVDLSAAAEAVPGFAGKALYGPSATTALTVVATHGADGVMTLRAAAR